MRFQDLEHLASEGFAPYCSLDVLGTPRPGGSKTSMPIVRDIRGPLPKGGLQSIREVRDFISESVVLGVRVFDSGTHTKTWRAAIVRAAKVLDLPEPIKGGEYAVHFVFRMPRPQYHFRKSGLLKPGSPQRPTIKPDVLKLARAAEDALSGIVWHDDSEITSELIEKVYGENPGALLMVLRRGAGVD